MWELYLELNYEFSGLLEIGESNHGEVGTRSIHHPALERIFIEGGVILSLRQEDRGIGLPAKL